MCPRVSPLQVSVGLWMNAIIAPALAGNQASTSPACEAALSDGPSPAAASEPEDVAEEVVSPEQRKARRKRKRNEVESRLSFADELGDGEEEAAASPRASLGALTAGRFEAEAKASRKRSSSSSSSSQRLLREAALSSAPLSPPPAAPARQWSRDGPDDSPLPAGQQPLLLHAVARAKGGRPYMEDRRPNPNPNPNPSPNPNPDPNPNPTYTYILILVPVASRNPWRRV